jgi:hypothetical protein
MEKERVVAARRRWCGGGCKVRSLALVGRRIEIAFSDEREREEGDETE